MNIESHSRSHPDMRNRSFEYLMWQILGPIEAITAYTGRRPHFFCYPSGQYDDAVIRVLRSVETWGAVTTRMGNQHGLEDSMTWSRMRVHGTTSLSDFAVLVK
jgi:peptidoglycan/xylan/chitin deacetylase (PgdA/CDA1 family)